MVRTELLEDPELRPFLPMLLLAWSDGDLDSDEVTALDAHIERMPWLRPATRLALKSWLDPSAPPTSLEFRALRDALERVVGTLTTVRRRELLGLAKGFMPEGAGADAQAAFATLQQELVGDDDTRWHDRAVTPTVAPVPTGAPARESAFPVPAMRALLDGEEHATRDRVRAFLDSPKRRAYALEIHAYRAKVNEWVGELAAEGFGALAYPGVTSDAKDLGKFFAVFETLAMGDLSLLVKCGVQFGLFGGSIFFLGRPEQRAEYLPRVARGELLGCFAMSEVGRGSDVQRLGTEAHWDTASRTFTIVTPSESARKDWIGGAAESARVATVFANLIADEERHGIHGFVVPIRDAQGKLCEGVRAGDCGTKMGLNGVDNGRLWFDAVKVPESALLGRFAYMTSEGKYESPIASSNQRFFTMLGTLVGGRVSVASGSITAAKVGLTIAVRYADVRRPFESDDSEKGALPLLDYPQHQRRLLPRLATTYVLSFAMAELQARFVAAQHAGKDGVPTDPRELEAAAAAFKALASTHAVETLAECRRACGGQGYLAVNRFSDLMNDVEIFTTFEGDNTVLLQLVARSLLSGFKKRFENKGLGGVVRHVAKRAEIAAREKNPVARRRADSEHLRDGAFHIAALRYREETLLTTAGQRLKKRISRGDDAGNAVLGVQEHLVALAWAHADRLALEWFHARTKNVEGPLAAQLERVGSLYALTRIRDEAAFYFSEGYLEPSKEKAMRKETEKLLYELRGSALDLVDAFGIPDVALAAPIAFMDPAHPRW